MVVYLYEYENDEDLGNFIEHHGDLLDEILHLVIYVL